MSDCDNKVNPETGLPMDEGCFVDIGGNPFGVDLFDDSASMDMSTDDWINDYNSFIDD